MNRLLNYLFILGYAVLALACSQSKAPTGKATITGKFSGVFPIEKTFNFKVSVPDLAYFNVFKQFDEYETKVDLNGNFSLSIPLFSPVYALFSINDEELGALFLSPDKETKIELSLTDSNKIQVKVIKGQELTMEDIEKTIKPLMEFTQNLRDPINSLSGLRWDMSPEEYKNYILQWTDKQISTIVDGDKDLPENLKQLMHRGLKWLTFTDFLFDYEGETRWLYENKRNSQENSGTVFTPIKPDKSYYSFLSYFDWNNPPVFNAPTYPGMFKRILTDSIINITGIVKSQSLTDWLKEVKSIMNPLIGSDSGMFYDMLTLHAYMNQLDDDSKPLSNRQIEDIKTYFKNPTYSQYLFEKNEALLKQLKQTKFPSIIKETPSANKEKLMEAIVSSYKGKAVVVDFWATWCSPCREAMKSFKPLKEEFLSKNIIFVYLTNESSPKELWEKTIQDISGEHYYLTKEESENISKSKQYGFDSVPTYMFFDSNGKLKNKISGYPGNEEMREMIEKLF